MRLPPANSAEEIRPAHLSALEDDLEAIAVRPQGRAQGVASSGEQNRLAQFDLCSSPRLRSERTPFGLNGRRHEKQVNGHIR
jgi:hypothetical protein